MGSWAGSSKTWKTLYEYPCPEKQMKTAERHPEVCSQGGGVGCNEGQKMGQVQSRKAKQQKHREECTLASELERMKFNMQ